MVAEAINSSLRDLINFGNIKLIQRSYTKRVADTVFFKWKLKLQG